MNWFAILFALFSLWLAFTAGAGIVIAEQQGKPKLRIVFRLAASILISGLALYLQRTG